MNTHYRLAVLLVGGGILTSNEIKSLFGLRNPSRAIHYIRNQMKIPIRSVKIGKSSVKRNARVEYVYE